MKQALTLLHFARWIQCCKTTEWEEAGLFFPEAGRPPLAYQLRLILIGAAGTGKSTILRIVEALADKFFGPASVRKCAPSNAAARVVGGDTIHALCKLPFVGGLYGGAKSYLSVPVLRVFKERWRTAKFIYEGVNQVYFKSSWFHISAGLCQECHDPLHVALEYPKIRPFPFLGWGRRRLRSHKQHASLRNRYSIRECQYRCVIHHG